MNARPLALAAMLATLAMLGGCSARQVDVRTAPAKATAVSIKVTNNVNLAVNVYATLNGTDTFLGQVGANSSATLPAQGFAAGSTIGLKAVTVDGAKTYSRANVVLNGTYDFPLP